MNAVFNIDFLCTCKNVSHTIRNLNHSYHRNVPVLFRHHIQNWHSLGGVQIIATNAICNTHGSVTGCEPRKKYYESTSTNEGWKNWNIEYSERKSLKAIWMYLWLHIICIYTHIPEKSSANALFNFQYIINFIWDFLSMNTCCVSIPFYVNDVNTFISFYKKNTHNDYELYFYYFFAFQLNYMCAYNPTGTKGCTQLSILRIVMQSNYWKFNRDPLTISKLDETKFCLSMLFSDRIILSCGTRHGSYTRY